MNIVTTERLGEEDVLRKAEVHRARLSPHVLPHLHRAGRGETHPVMDFLFQYYAFPAMRILAWSPGLGQAVPAHLCNELGLSKGFSVEDGWASPDPSELRETRLSGLEWTLSLLERISLRPARHHCYGLHEWAMVYRSNSPRHQKTPLRLPPEEIARLVESHSLACTHFDAFRFFTPAAKPLNLLQLERTRQLDHEQPGCIHVNMDLYKWAGKYWPWIDSDLLGDTFLLAVEARHLDMAASPYDLLAFEVEPIPIETVEGRRIYAALQADIAAKARPLRARLLLALRALREAVGN